MEATSQPPAATPARPPSLLSATGVAAGEAARLLRDWQRARLPDWRAAPVAPAASDEVTALAYCFWRPEEMPLHFFTIEAAFRATWAQCGRLRSKLVAGSLFPGLTAFCEAEGVEVEVAPELTGSLRAMNRDCILKLHTRFDTSHVLIIQNDGFPLRPGLRRFVGLCDYVGAPWEPPAWPARLLFPPSRHAVGNGGFSLRSRRICEMASWHYRRGLRAIPESWFTTEDVFYCRVLPRLSRRCRRALTYAPPEVAGSFSFEACGGHLPGERLPFGFHGPWAFRVLCRRHEAVRTAQACRRQARRVAGKACRTFAVVPLCRPSPATLRRWIAWAGQVDRLLLFDNTPRPPGEPPAAEIAGGGPPNLTWVAEGANRGVAHAYNHAARMAQAENCTHLLTLDQDSEPPDGMAEKLHGALSAAEWRRTGLIGPLHVETAAGQRPQETVSFVDGLMSSGNLVNLAAWKIAGGYNEDLFVDHVDTDFCLRLRLAGFRIARHNGLPMPHRLGASRTHSFLGRQVVVSHHPPVRRYLMARNTVALVRAHGRRVPGLRSRQTRELLATACKVLLFERRKGAQMLAILRGLRDGLARRGGGDICAEALAEEQR